MRKRFFVLLLTFSLVMTLIPASLSIAREITEDDLIETSQALDLFNDGDDLSGNSIAAVAETPPAGWIKASALNLWWNGATNRQMPSNVTLDGATARLFNYRSWSVGQWSATGGGSDPVLFLGPSSQPATASPENRLNGDFNDATMLRATFYIPEEIRVPATDFGGTAISPTARPSLSLGLIQGNENGNIGAIITTTSSGGMKSTL
jgi:hypothetical protein